MLHHEWDGPWASVAMAPKSLSAPGAAAPCSALAALNRNDHGRAGGTVARLSGPAIGEVHAVRSARIALEHVVPRKRIGVVGYLTVEPKVTPLPR